MKYVNEEQGITISFGVYAKKGQYYWAIPETKEELIKMLNFEEPYFRNINLKTNDNQPKQGSVDNG